METSDKAIAAGLGVWAIKELYSIFKKDTEKNTSAVNTLTLAVVELRSELKRLINLAEPVPKLKEDMNKAWGKLKEHDRLLNPKNGVDKNE